MGTRYKDHNYYI